MRATPQSRLIRGTRPAYPHHVLGHLGLCISFFGLVVRTLRNYTEVCRKARVLQRFLDVTVELETRCDRDEVQCDRLYSHFDDASYMGC